MRVLSLDDIARKAPSVFATQPWEGTSEKYRFFPTVEVVKALIGHGFHPTFAKQSNTRIEGKGNFTKHILRFRHADFANFGKEQNKVGDEVPEIILLNSHDGSSSYQISLGIFRLVCSNGLIVKSHEFNEIRVRHSGHESIIGDVIEGSYQIIEEAPKVARQIETWKATPLLPQQQVALASAALEVRDSTLEVQPTELLRVRRFEDKKDDLWTTFNRVQENLVRGGVQGENANGQRRRLRGVNSVDADTKLNRALWVLAEQLGQHVKAA